MAGSRPRSSEATRAPVPYCRYWASIIGLVGHGPTTSFSSELAQQLMPQQPRWGQLETALAPKANLPPLDGRVLSGKDVVFVEDEAPRPAGASSTSGAAGAAGKAPAAKATTRSVHTSVGTAAPPSALEWPCLAYSLMCYLEGEPFERHKGSAKNALCFLD